MKRFAFPHEPLARLRRIRREAREALLAEGRLRRERRKAEQEALAARRTAAADGRRRALSGTFDPAEARIQEAHVAALDRLLVEAGGALADADRELEERRQACLEASRAEEALERLRGRARGAWEEAAGREAQALVDEAALSLHRSRP